VHNQLRHSPCEAKQRYHYVQLQSSWGVETKELFKEQRITAPALRGAYTAATAASAIATAAATTTATAAAAAVNCSVLVAVLYTCQQNSASSCRKGSQLREPTA
jgi:hypothetical protein